MVVVPADRSLKGEREKGSDGKRERERESVKEE